MNLLDLGNGVNRFKFPIKIHLMCNWDTSENLSKLWEKMRPNNSNIKLVEFKEADYYVVINGLNGIDKIPPLNKTICMAMEPDWEIDSVRWKKNPQDGKDWFNSRDDFLYLLDHKYRNNSEWHLSKTIQQLKSQKIEKTKKLSSIMSSLELMKQHRERISFLKDLDSTLSSEEIDIYGRDNNKNYKNYRGMLPSHQKDDGIFPYKYTFIAENCDKENYFTEKLIDAILGECLCFYSGPSNIEDFIDPRAFYKVELSEERTFPNGENKREDEIKKVINAMNNGEWEKRIEFIKKEKQKILNYYNFFTRVEYLIDISKMKKIVLFSTEDRKNNFISKYKEKINSVGDLQFEEYKTDLKTHSAPGTPGTRPGGSGSVGAQSGLDPARAGSDFKQVKERNNLLFPNLILDAFKQYQKIENDILVLNECSNFTKHFLDKLGIVYTKAKEISDWDVLILDRGNQMTNNTYCEILKHVPLEAEVSERLATLKSEVPCGSENYILNSRTFYKKDLSDLIIYKTQEKLIEIN